MTTKYLIPNVTKCLFAALFISLFYSCNDDEMATDDGIVDAVNFTVAIDNLTLIDNNVNAADIALSLSPPSLADQITAAKIVIAKSVSADQLDTDRLWELSANSFQTLENFGSFNQIQLDASLLDTDGDNLSVHQSYRVGIISQYAADENMLYALGLSNEFKLISFQQGVYNLPITFASNAGLDAIAINSHGHLLVSNYGSTGNGSEVFKATSFGLIEEFGVSLSAPLGSVIDNADNLYVINSGSITKVDANGNQSLFLNSTENIAGLAFDNGNNLYATQYSDDKVLKIDNQGNVEVFAQNSNLLGSVGIVYYAEEDAFFISNFDNGKIYKLSLKGELTLLAQVSGIGYLTEMNGYLYATLFSSHQIARVSFTGEVTIVAGSSGVTGQAAGELSVATFHNPNGICADEGNNVLYVTDWGSPRISKIQL